MEIFWESGEALTSAEVIQRLKGRLEMTPKMVRVLMNRLCQKGILGYTRDEKDARVYHYSVLKPKEECLKSKSQRFVDSYFSGNQTMALNEGKETKGNDSADVVAGYSNGSGSRGIRADF